MELGYYQNKTTGWCVKALMIAEDRKNGAAHVVYARLRNGEESRVYIMRPERFLQEYWKVTHAYDEHRPCDLCGLLKNGTRPEQPVYKPGPKRG